MRTDQTLWSYEWRADGVYWVRALGIYHDPGNAARAAAIWMQDNATNDTQVQVRLVRVPIREG